MLWKIKRALNVGNEWHITRDHKVITDFVSRILDQKESGTTTASIRDVDGGEQYDLLSLYVKHNPDLTRNELKDIALSYFSLLNIECGPKFDEITNDQ